MIITLGGGQWGYLALVLLTTGYASIPGTTPFICPTVPGTFLPFPPAGSEATTRSQAAAAVTALTYAEITAQKLTHYERLRRYNECQAVELFILQR